MCIKSSSRGAPPPPRAPLAARRSHYTPAGGKPPATPAPARCARFACSLAAFPRGEHAAPPLRHMRRLTCANMLARLSALRKDGKHRTKQEPPTRPPVGGGRLPLGYHAPSVEKSAKIKSATNKAIPPHPPRLWRWYVGVLAPQLVRTALNYLHKPEAPRQWQLSLRL